MVALGGSGTGGGRVALPPMWVAIGGGQSGVEGILGDSSWGGESMLWVWEEEVGVGGTLGFGSFAAPINSSL